MKKTILYISIALLLTSTGCKKWVEGYDVSPNSPSDVNLASLLSSSELAATSVFTGQLARSASIFTQQSAGTDFQMKDVAIYNVTESDNLNEWQTIYSGALINMQTMIDKAGTESPYYAGIGRILKSMTIGLATDYWGDIPYSEALQGLNGPDFFNPKYDKQQDIIASIQSELDKAILELSKNPEDNKYLPGADDFMHGGDNDAWIKTAYIIKLRYTNRLSKKDPSGSATTVLSLFDESGLNSGNDLFAVFGPNGNELNSWNSFNVNRAGYVQMGKYLVELLKTTGDPRLPLYCSHDEAGGYSGTAKDSFNTNTSALGTLYGDPTSPLPLALYSEALYIKAEAHFRLGQNAEAAAAFNEAVKESIKRTTGGSNPTYEATYANEDASTITLEKIMTQKYIDMFTQPEVWADWRRTELPVLQPNPEGVLSGIPQRLKTPIDERINNSNAVVVSNMLQKVWWNQ